MANTKTMIMGTAGAVGIILGLAFLGSAWNEQADPGPCAQGIKHYSEALESVIDAHRHEGSLATLANILMSDAGHEEESRKVLELIKQNEELRKEAIRHLNKVVINLSEQQCVPRNLPELY